MLLKSFFKSTLHIMRISYFIVKLMKKENPCTLMKRYQWLEARTQDFGQGGARFFRNKNSKNRYIHTPKNFAPPPWAVFALPLGNLSQLFVPNFVPLTFSRYKSRAKLNKTGTNKNMNKTYIWTSGREQKPLLCLLIFLKGSFLFCSYFNGLLPICEYLF